jgi:hypothetical protein
MAIDIGGAPAARTQAWIMDTPRMFIPTEMTPDKRRAERGGS